MRDVWWVFVGHISILLDSNARCLWLHIDPETSKMLCRGSIVQPPGKTDTRLWRISRSSRSTPKSMQNAREDPRRKWEPDFAKPRANFYITISQTVCISMLRIHVYYVDCKSIYRSPPWPNNREEKSLDLGTEDPPCTFLPELRTIYQYQICFYKTHTLY